MAAAAGPADLPTWGNIVVAPLLVGAYGLHTVRTLRSGGALEEVPERLILWRRASRPPTWAILAKVVGALGLMVSGAYVFVGAVEGLSEALGIPVGLVSLILAPLATELPEKFNSVIWVREGKDTLAMGNVTGAMLFQSTIPVAIGVLFTPWNLSGLGFLSALLALVSGGPIYWRLRRKAHILDRRLLAGGAFYALFVAAAVVTVVSP